MLEEFLQNLITDDALSDFDYNFNNFSPFGSSPEKNLMVSVLLYGIIDFISYKKSEYEEAKEWLETDDTDSLYSFQNICFILNLEPESFKAKILKLRELPNLAKKSKQLKHLNPAPGNRNKISINSMYKFRKNNEEIN